jgi:uncharacterized membrane protein YkvA (DUF1232 family)
MSWWSVVLAACAVVVLAWAIFVVLLLVVGRRSPGCAALARFVPDCLVLMRRLVADARVPRRRKLVLLVLVAYLVLPVDLVPDVIPVAGQLDDVVVLALALRFVLRSAGAAIVREHWPGPEESLSVLNRIAALDQEPSTALR